MPSRVLIASAKRSDVERIAGLRMGADDYLAKPYNPHELTARVAAVLRRSRGSRDGTLGTGLSTASNGPDVNEDALSFDSGRLVVEPGSRRYRLRARADAGAAVFVSTHHLADLADVVDHLVVLGRGRLVAAGPVDRLLDDAGAASIEELVLTSEAS